MRTTVKYSTQLTSMCRMQRSSFYTISRFLKVKYNYIHS
nr:MAG TPA: hypothetical protein [Caudoviricetes sp.]